MHLSISELTVKPADNGHLLIGSTSRLPNGQPYRAQPPECELSPQKDITPPGVGNVHGMVELHPKT